MARTRRHWWNGKWGRLARRDIFIRQTPSGVELELREGGYDGRSVRATFPTEGSAVVEAERRMQPHPTDDWREVSS
ncbi:hypothetical protein GCM10010123_01860 [Pilimelia anulata]|uniref:Uncharacterized protein n=1 Tax=Pilimelia anulata TaxID=53371 RepID=A0A8J3F5X2_9ACTN|nr:hypothetical protein GCM10010123_01860 [Pilimelia anulata]